MKTIYDIYLYPLSLLAALLFETPERQPNHHIKRAALIMVCFLPFDSSQGIKVD